MLKYNVIYHSDTDVSVLKTTLSEMGVVVHEEFSELKVLNISANDTSFSSVSGIIAFEEDVEISVTASSTPWHLLRLSTPMLPMKSSYAPKNFGEQGVVYLVDSGVDSSHEQFSNTNIVNLHSYLENDFTDTTGHGTAMASLIVGNTLGASKNATLKNVKIPMSASTTLSVLLSAFNSILSDHTLTSGVKVVNCSWTIPKSQILDTKIQELQNAGLVVVAAAGNTGEAADNFSPVGLDTVIGVAASDAYDRVISWATGASSNWGPEVDVTAPGIDIEVASIHTESGYATSSGTSLASALVSGVVCQYITADPTLTADEIKSQIILPPYSSTDILFRNETIYGTTPNRLVHCLFLDALIENIKTPVIIKAGETSTFNLQLTQYVDAVNVHNVAIGARQHEIPSWASFDTETNTFTFNPPADITTKRIVIMLEIFFEGERLGVPGVDLRIYHNDTNEVETEENYHLVLRGNESDVVYITPAACGGGCSYWTYCNPASSGKQQCVCSTNWGGYCYTGLSV
jgi:hypothetical protein